MQIFIRYLALALCSALRRLVCVVPGWPVRLEAGFFVAGYVCSWPALDILPARPRGATPLEDEGGGKKGVERWSPRSETETYRRVTGCPNVDRRLRVDTLLVFHPQAGVRPSLFVAVWTLRDEKALANSQANKRHCPEAGAPGGRSDRRWRCFEKQGRNP